MFLLKNKNPQTCIWWIFR